MFVTAKLFSGREQCQLTSVNPPMPSTLEETVTLDEEWLLFASLMNLQNKKLLEVCH